MCRITKLHQFFRARELMVHVNIRHIAAFKFAVLVLGVAHWVGCLFYFLSRLAGFSNAANSATWIQQFDANTPMNYNCTNNGTIFDLYGVTLYKGLNGISNLGYDPVVPERYCFLTCHITLHHPHIAACLLSSCLHWVTVHLQNPMIVGTSFKAWVRRLLLVMSDTHCMRELYNWAF